MGAASGMTRIAGALAPSLGALMVGASLALPLTVFALSFVIGGAASLGLPIETSQQPLADLLTE
jgi:MFS transporter, putative metabolite:H+ symporter